MSIKYDSKREALSEIVKNATQNATFLIPDLQRPYVWTPRQVILLIDSLFKGWPFGSILLWEVKTSCYSQNEGIPFRAFWQIVDKTSDNCGIENSTKSPPATYYMVLDGQQRIQSLLLALGGDSWGFKLYDHEWALDLNDRRMKFGKHWSKASLCLDLQLFSQELANKDKKVRKIEIGNILKWTIIDDKNDLSNTNRPDSYEHPLPRISIDSNRFIRLSRLWDIVQSGLSESEYRDVLEPVLSEYGILQETSLVQSLAEFMKLLETVKCNSFIHALQIDSFVPTPQWQKDDYSDAIVNIFTRLNTAGRTLTREEITLAWLKVGWEPKYTNNKNAGECLLDLQSYFQEKNHTASLDELVRFLSVIWVSVKLNGQLLDSKDLLKGELIRTMALYIAEFWKDIVTTVEIGIEILTQRYLLENQGSFNAVIIFLSHIYISKKWQENQKLSVLDKDTYEKQIISIFSLFSDRWIYSTQWANVWAESATRNFSDFALALHNYHQKLSICNNVEDAITVTQDACENILSRVNMNAIMHVQSFNVKDRKRVYLYHSMLWVWHRLDKKRWEYSTIQMRTGRKRKSTLEVDHTIADAFWKRLLDEEVKKRSDDFLLQGKEEEIILDGIGTIEIAHEIVNKIGNCTLLEKTFNISKSDKQMWDFLKEVHEFKNKSIVRDTWEQSLKINSVMLEPSSVPLKDLTMQINERDMIIRQELVDFLNGKIYRQDVDN